MRFGSILTLSVGLAMDAMAVAAARGLACKRVRFRDAAVIGGFFGGCQALMPLGGWLIGRRLGPLVEVWDHWIAFALLGGLGVKMLLEARRGTGEPSAPTADPFGLRVMLVLAIATSIDAAAAGVMLPMLNAPLLLSVATIGVTTAVLSVLGLFLGRHFGALLGRGLDAFGGLVLIAMGTKILIEHLSAR
jgi:putative Mn2+ efflux pump MntP